MPTQSTDISGDPYGITYGAVGETWKILKGVDVSGATSGISSTYLNSTLDNNGSIVGGVLGVSFDGSGATSVYVIDNQSKGEIQGQVGIFLVNFTGSAFVQNKGAILGGAHGIFAYGSSDVAIENTGTISGGELGMLLAGVSSGVDGAYVENAGTIEGGNTGIGIGGSLRPAEVKNLDGGVIKGSLSAIYSEAALRLDNKGKILGDVVSNALADEIVNRGKIKGDVRLGSSDDTFKSKGNAKAGLIDTQGGNDVVAFGNKADKLLFDSALSAATNVDTIKKFASGKDAIYLDDDIFTEIAPGRLSSAAFHKGKAAADADDRIIYDKKSGALSYDPDGTGALAQTRFAEFDKGTKLKASDFTIGEYSIL